MSQYAHDQKLIHRDVKPENMLLDQDNTIVLSDFGIALMSQSSRYQNTQEVAGTAAYMAPEQFQGHPHRASDQYALGVVVYEWLTGDRPFHGSFTEIASQHLFVPPPPLRGKVPNIFPEVEQVVLTVLEKDPQRRFGSVQAFATALEQACQRTATNKSDALNADSPFPNQSSPSDDKTTVIPPRQVSQLSATEPASPIPTGELSAKPLERPSSLFHFQRQGKNACAPETRSNLTVANHRQSLYISRIVLLVGLALLVLIGSLGLYNVIRTRTGQITISYADATATTQTKAANAVATLVRANYATATTQAQVAATVTATIAYNNYVQATSGTPVLDDPLPDNSKGNIWAEDNYCRFSGGTYHVTMLSGGFRVSYAHPTFNNFAFQVQMTILKGDYGGIVFRTNQAQPFGYRFAFRSDQAQSGGGDLAYGNQPLLAKFTAITAHLNQAYLLTVIARGSSISLYIDKQLVMSVEDSSASSGNIGLLTGDINNAADVVFRNVQVWNL